MNKPISPYFTLVDLTASQTATRKRIQNKPGEKEITALGLLCMNILDPLHERLKAAGKGFVITSGFRSVALNKAVGGSPFSQHVRGQAADLVPHGMTAGDLFRYLRASDLPFDQVIAEGTWVHVSHKPGGPQRRQAMIADFSGKSVSYRDVTDSAVAQILADDIL